MQLDRNFAISIVVADRCDRYIVQDSTRIRSHERGKKKKKDRGSIIQFQGQRQLSRAKNKFRIFDEKRFAKFISEPFIDRFLPEFCAKKEERYFDGNILIPSILSH